MSKKILIVGAGFGQLPAIHASKKIGLEVITVDQNPDAVGMKYADYAYPIDILDKDAVLDVARKHMIDGLMTMQSDIAVPTIGYINDILGLNGVSYNVALYCSNKIETRKRLSLKNCQQPRFIVISKVNEAKKAAIEIGFPCVIKAPDSSGSRGVVKVNSMEEVESAYEEAKKNSRENLILVEEYISGLEFGAQTFSINGKCEVVLLHNDTMSSPPYMIPIGHSFPFKYIDKINENEVIQDIKNAVEALGILNGPANVDLIFDLTTNSIKIIEIGARIGATCLPELVHYHTNVDWVLKSILNALNEKVDITIEETKPVAASIIQSPKDGLFESYEVLDNAIDESLEFEITTVSGDMVNILRKGTDRIGKVLSYGLTPDDAENKVNDILKKIKINVK